ncbi:MAG TPA: protein kinase [Thermoanaerobaculia bacterium]|nr:protein kinase [Thermoanaerobaculia bacterium]
MMISTGSRLGPYEILSPLGAGGMGEVYKARDTRLERTVAIKVLPSHLSASPDVRQRFEREAKTISQLSHPNICALYDVGREGETEYLVLEYLEGETLAQRLAKGPLPLDQALKIGSQIAEALDAAHRMGIVHRDLKPGNVMVTKSGARVLDFGLAKLREEDAQPAASRVSALATRDAPLTAEGTILGTVQYMAPEQLEGRKADARADIFAFGVTLYETVTGRKAFSGASQASLLSAILATEPPPVSASQAMSPPALDRLVETCLAKDPEHRWQSARDIALQIAMISEARDAAPAPAPGAFRRSAPWVIAASVLSLAIVLLLRARAPQTPAANPIRFSVPPPAGGEFASWVEGAALQLSPDARQLAFVAHESDGRARAWVRALSSLDARPIDGTEGANSIFWSPDGGSLAFFARGRLARVAVSGGEPVPICEVGGGVGRSGSWGAGGQILFADVQGDAIYGVSADGGKPEVVVRSDPTRGVFRVQWPSFLPDGRSFLYLAWGAISSRSADGTLMLTRPGKPPTAITPLRSRAEMLEPGYLIFAREGALFGQRFDPVSAKLAGPPLPIAASVNYFLSTGFADFTARAGTLAYHSQKDVLRLTWFDRAGRALGSVGGPGRYLDVAIAPDGKRFLFSRARPGIWTFDVWMFDIARGVETPLTSEPGSEFGGLWLPDGKSILYSVARGRAPQLVLRRLAGGEELEVQPSGGFQVASAVSPDGRLLAYSERAPGAFFDAWILPLESGARPARFSSGAPADSLLFSPDGRAVAFLSSESGRREAYVAPFGSPGEKVRVSTDGANLLRFSRDGTELFYLSPDGRLIAVPIRTVPSVEPGEPRTLFRLAPGPGWQNFDVAPDGRFLAVVSEVSGSAQPATVVVNWTAEAPKK